MEYEERKLKKKEKERKKEGWQKCLRDNKKNYSWKKNQTNFNPDSFLLPLYLP